MSLLTINPPPGQYLSDQTVTITPLPGYSLLATNDGSDPVIVKTIASTNKLGSEMPYIQTVDDGRGRAIFDGAFAKYYNEGYSSDLNAPTNKFYINTLNYITKGKGKKIFIFTDRLPSDNSYMLKDQVISNSFGKTLRLTAEAAGFTITMKDPSDYGGLTNPTYAEMSQYDAIFFMSASSGIPAGQLITSAAAAAVAAARKAGIGLYICTDNNPWYDSANILLTHITDAYFEGLYDFSPGTTVGYNKNLHGDSPLFIGMLDTDIVQASQTDSNVVQTATDPSSSPVNFQITTGHTQLKFAVIDSGGNITFEQHGYSVNVPPIIELCDSLGNSIEALPTNYKKTRQAYFNFKPITEGQLVSGFVKIDDTVIGTFNNESTGILNINWLDTIYTTSTEPNVIEMPGLHNKSIIVELYDPLVFIYKFDFNRLVPNSIFNSELLYLNLFDILDLQSVKSVPELLKLLKEKNTQITSDVKLPVYLKNSFDFLKSE